ncbi:MAG TPA: hypothetical protein DCQ64_22315 [Candidatus Rokubacteria bacterium]|nr:hypothetical protein [Candidatus Rokubacteria bacterium]
MPDPNIEEQKKPDDTPPDPKAVEIEALKRKNAEVIAENRKLTQRTKELADKGATADALEQRFQKISEVFGVDLKKQDPAAQKAEQEEQQRSALASQKAEQDRALRIERKVLLSLSVTGKALDEEVAEMIVGHAKTSKLITYDPETGKVEGTEEFLAKILEKFGGSTGSGDQRPRNPPIAKPGAGEAGPSAKFANVKTFQQLVEMGETARAEYQRNHPTQYEALRAANLHSARTPAHTVAQAPGR